MRGIIIVSPRLAPATGRTGRHIGALLVVLLMLDAILLVAACAHVAPGEDPVVVRTEQALVVADAIYRDAMGWYFTPGVAATLSPSTTRVFEQVRTGFDPAYKGTQKALDAYKAVRRAIAAGQAGDQAAALQAVNDAVAKLAALVNQVLGNVPKPNQTLSKGRLVGGA